MGACRALRAACSRCSAADRAGPSASETASSQRHGVLGDRAADRSGAAPCRRAPRPARRRAPGWPAPGRPSWATRTAGGRCSCGPLGELAVGVAARVPADERLHLADVGIPHDQDPAPRPQPGGPATLRRTSGAAPPRPRAGRAGTGWRPRRAGPERRSRPGRDRARRRGWPRPSTSGARGRARTWSSPEEVTTWTPGRARPNSSAVRRTPTTTARTTCPAHTGHRQSGTGPWVLGRRAGDPAPGPAWPRRTAGTRPAHGRTGRPASAGSRPAGRSTSTGPGATAVRRTSIATEGIRRPGARRVGGQVGGHLDARHPRAQGRARHLDRPASPRGPSGHPRGSPRSPPSTRDVSVAALRSAATSRACQPGAMWLGQGLVAVVPDDDRAQVDHGGEDRRPGADHDPRGAGRARQERPVAGLGAGLGTRRSSRARCSAQRGRDAVDLGRVGGHDQDPRPRARTRRARSAIRGSACSPGAATHSARIGTGPPIPPSSSAPPR